MKITQTNEANHKANDQLWQKKSGIRLLILVAVSLFAGTISARAQTTVQLPKLVLEAKHTEYVSTGNPDTPEVTGVKSSNLSVARASVYRVTSVQIVAVAPGKTTVEFWDNAAQIRYLVPVWVTAPNSTGGGGGNYDPAGKVQLDQIVMLVKHTENVFAPNPGPSQISGIKSSNPRVATARTNTNKSIQIYSVALGDTFIEFTDNATGTTYQVHVWVSKPGDLPPSTPAPGPNPGPNPRPRPTPTPTPTPSPSPQPGPNKKIDPCLVGKWENVAGVGGQFQGGIGFRLTFKADGTQIADYSSMQPITLEPTRYYFAGSSVGRVTTQNGSARNIDTNNGVTLEIRLYGKPSQPKPSMGPRLGMNKNDNTYSCSGNTLAFNHEDFKGRPWLHITMKRVK